MAAAGDNNAGELKKAVEKFTKSAEVKLEKTIGQFIKSAKS